MSEPIDFAALTRVQQHTLGLVAINQDTGHNPVTLRKLESKGLIVGHDEPFPGHPPITLRRYTMPVHVHIQWCEWCARTTDEEDEP